MQIEFWSPFVSALVRSPDYLTTFLFKPSTKRSLILARAREIRNQNRKPELSFTNPTLCWEQTCQGAEI